MKRTIIVIIVAALILIVGFFVLNAYIYTEKQGDMTDTTVPPTDTNPIATSTTENVAKLKSASWVWINATYGDGTIHAPRQAGQFVLTFEEGGRFSARTDCNNTAGNYVADDHMIAFSEIVMTKMFCEGSREMEFARVLEQTQSYFFTDAGELVFDFKFDSGSAVFKKSEN